MREKKEACGIVGIAGNDRAAQLCATALFALQHRGEEAAGLVVSDGKRLHLRKGLGHVNKVFGEIDFKAFDGHRLAIGHTRYSITGGGSIENIQPMLVSHLKGVFALGHNGNLTNSGELKGKLEKEGAIFQTTMDSEIFMHLIARARAVDLKGSIIEAVREVRGAFSIVVLSGDTIYAFRDGHGFRPLVIGELSDGTRMVASETCALDLLSARYMGQVHAGELVTISGGELKKERILPEVRESKCIFEMIYFSRPDSLVFGESVYNFRRKVGEYLAEESPVEADIVVPVPDSGYPSALGYASASKLPLEFAITKNHYVGRSFIQPTADLRSGFVKLKLNPIKNVVYKKRIVLVDDSIVRGTTTKQKIIALREAGASEVHMRVASPPLKHPCYYGVDLPDKEELIANHKDDLAGICAALNLDSLAYISLDGLLRASEQHAFCLACFSGDYPVAVDFGRDKRALERGE